LNRFITFEGTEGSGKTTQIALLADSLRVLGQDVVVTREPGGTPLGEALRTLLLDGAITIGPVAEAYLMTAARAEHVHDVILPALGRGATVLCDRFCDSTLAYQGGGRGIPVADLREMQRLAIGGAVPDLTILLTVPVELGLERRTRANDGNRIDRERLDFHLRVSAAYAASARADHRRWLVIDATQTADVVHTAVLEGVTQRLGAGWVARTVR